ncbi:MAG TPA: MBL fold metallo-hydrolase [Clostridiales bacterium]|nr:MBL fold metallo-hydrolase [Clostridiales bacterium]
MRFCPLFSSSGGNATYIGTSREGILIDAGINCKQVSIELENIGINPATIKHIFVTHEHIDHCSALRVFAKKYGCKIIASNGTLSALRQLNHIPELPAYQAADMCEEITKTYSLDTMEITPFHTSHDSAESLGFTITDGDRKIAVISDTGMITDEIFDAVRGADLVMIESNHDLQMLKCGPYPPELQRRIRSKVGHLSNPDCAKTAVELLKSGTTRFVLSHLSQENNNPNIALNETQSALKNTGAVQNVDFILEVASVRNTRSKYLSF